MEYAITVLKEQAHSDLVDLGSSIIDKDKEIEKRQRERLDHLQDAMNLIRHYLTNK